MQEYDALILLNALDLLHNSFDPEEDKDPQGIIQDDAHHYGCQLHLSLLLKLILTIILVVTIPVELDGVRDQDAEAEERDDYDHKDY